MTSHASARPEPRDGLFAFPPAALPYEVSRVKIAEFADAIGDADPLYRDRAAARTAGYPDVIAPPTFAVAVRAAEFGRRVFGGAPPDGLGIDPALVLHVDEAYAHTRPLHAGDRVTVRITVESVRPVRDDEILVIRSDLTGADDAPVSTVRTTLFVRGGRPVR